MMNLLGAGNPYIRRYAEGGEATPAETPKRYNTYSEFIQDVVNRIPGVADITADYRFLTSHETRPYMDQAIAEAKAKHDEELPALFEQAKQRELNRIIDEDYQKRAALPLQQQQGVLTATKPGDVFTYGPSKYLQYQFRVLPNGQLEKLGMDGQPTGTIESPEYRQQILDDIQAKLDGSRKTAEFFAQRSIGDVFPAVANQLADNYLKTVYEPFVDQRYRELLPRRTDIPFNQLNARLSELVTPYTNQLTRELFDQVRQEQQGIDAFILPQLLALNEEEQLKNVTGDDVVAAEYQRRREYLQNQARAMKEASQRKADYLFSPEYDLSKGPGELDRIYQEVLRQEMERLNPTLVPSVPSGGMTSPTVPSSPSVSPTPVAPRPPTVPAPVLPTTPSSPTGNLLPQPLIGSSSVGIPRPGIGTSILPQYQSPTSQAVQPTQQQQQPQMQIQYGPIGQGAVSSADLLKNLLASTQQSMPFDFTANNPYLMNQQPVQFFAEGGEAKEAEKAPVEKKEEEIIRYANPTELLYGSIERDPRIKMLTDDMAIIQSWPEFGTKIDGLVQEKRLQEGPTFQENYINNIRQSVMDQSRDEYLRRQSYMLDLAQQAREAKPGDTITDVMLNARYVVEPGEANRANDIANFWETRYQKAVDYSNTVAQMDWRKYWDNNNAAVNEQMSQMFENNVLNPYKQNLIETMLPKTQSGYTDIRSLRKERSPLIQQYEQAIQRAYDKFTADKYGAQERYYQKGVEPGISDPYYNSIQAESVAAARAYDDVEKYLLSSQFNPFSSDLDRFYNDRFSQYFQEERNRWLTPTTLIPSTGGQVGVPAQQMPTAPTAPVSGTPTTPGASMPSSIPSPVLPSPGTTPSFSGSVPLPGSNLTPSFLPNIPRPGIGSSALPQYQSPTSQATQPTQQPQQQQIQYGPIGQGAVGQASLLSTLLSQQQDPTKVSLLGFDNPYLMKPFG